MNSGNAYMRCHCSTNSKWWPLWVMVGVEKRKISLIIGNGWRWPIGKEFVPDEKQPHFATWKKNTIFNPNCRQIIEKDVVKWFR